MKKWLDEDFLKQFGKLSGVDEAGRGPLAGPVVAAAVYLTLDQEQALVEKISFIDDSKKLCHKKRELIFEYVKQEGIQFAIGLCDESIIDQENILKSTNMAMNSALERLGIHHNVALIDGKNLSINHPNRQIVKGDSLILRIALASNIAKVVRDKIMAGFSKLYPEFHFEKHKGYGTQAHLKALEKYGPTPIHRLTFKPLCDMITQQKLNEWLTSGNISEQRYRCVLNKSNLKQSNQKQLSLLVNKEGLDL